MPTYCISDLHLCDKGPRDNFCFNGREARFHKFLDHVKACNGRLIVLGDLFDWWQTNLSDSVLAYLPLIDRLAAMNATYVVGNHDCALTKFIGSVLMPAHPIFQRCRLAFEETIGSRRFAFLHGHEADPYCRDMNPGTGEITAIISGILEDRNNGPFRCGHAVEDEFVGTLESALTIWRTLTFQYGRLAEMIDGVETYRREASVQVVIYGHTHEPGQIGDHHFNTGCWARQQDTFVRIEDDGTASVWRWGESGATPYEHSLK